MRILHLSDLHMQADKAPDQLKIVSALLADLEKQQAQRKVDLCVFTGDLTFSSKPNEYILAEEKFLKPLCRVLSLSNERLILVHGNHDNDLDLVSNVVESGLRQSLRNKSALNKLMDDSGDFELAILRTTPWKNFVSARFKESDSIVCDPLGLVHTLAIDGIRVVIACFDTAWRSKGGSEDEERHKLMIGERQLDAAVKKLGQADIFIAAMHHPLDWLSDFDASDVKRVLCENFDILLTGHTHATQANALAAGAGSYIHSAAGALFQGREELNTYSLIDIVHGDSVRISVRQYVETRDEFAPCVELSEDGSVSFPHRSADSNVLEGRVLEPEAALASRLAAQAGSLILSGMRERSVVGALLPPALPQGETIQKVAAQAEKILVDPVFLPVPHEQWVASEDPKTRVRLARSNPISQLESCHCLVLVGEEGSGLTSALDLLSLRAAATRSGYVPVQLSAGMLRSRSEPVQKAARKALIEVDLSVELGPSLPHLILAIEEFSKIKQHELRRLVEYLATSSEDVAILGCHPGEEQERITNALERGDVCYRVTHIGRFGRREIRELISRLDIERAASVLETVASMLAKEGLSRTPFMISALVSVVSRSPTFCIRESETDVVEAYIDLLLGRSDLREDSRLMMDYRGREHLLSALSGHMFEEGTGILSRCDLEEFLAKYFKAFGREERVSDVLDALINRHILLESRDHRISFRQSALLGFFAAKRMYEDEEFRRRMYREALDFPIVIRHAAALKRTDTELLSTLQELMPEVPALTTDFYAREEPSEEMGETKASGTLSRYGEAEELRPAEQTSDDTFEGEDRSRDGIVDSEDQEFEDEMWDRAAERPARDIAQVLGFRKLPPFFQLESSTSTLSAVLRSSELVADSPLKQEVLQDVLSRWASVARFLGDEPRIEQLRTALERELAEDRQPERQRAAPDVIIERIMVLFPSIVAFGGMSYSLVSAKLAGIAGKVLANDAFMKDPGQALMAVRLAQQLRVHEWEKALCAVFDQHGDVFAVRAALAWLCWAILSSPTLTPEEEDVVIDLLARVRARNLMRGRLSPSQLSEDRQYLKKARLRRLMRSRYLPELAAGIDW